jgi:hypothetical protein
VVQSQTHPGRYHRSGLAARQGLRWDPQTAGRGVHLQRPHAHRHRQPLEFQAGRRAAFGRHQPPELVSEAKRVNQAARVRQFVDTLLDANPNANIIVLGDLNDFWFSPPLATLTTGATPDQNLLDLMTMLAPEERYGHVFEGNSEDLDHLVISPRLEAGLVPGSIDVVLVNAEFADHDPQVARFLLPVQIFLRAWMG